jgi:hypothetical protein
LEVEDEGMKIAWGLEAQGHISTIKNMLAAGNGWSDISVAIGWDEATARRHYEEYLKKHNQEVDEMNRP